jgi:hypothetical protein
METGLSQSRILSERSILVQVRLPSSDVDERDPLGELRALADTAGVQVVGEMQQNLKVPRGATYLGKGKVEELGAMVQALDAAGDFGKPMVTEVQMLSNYARAEEYHQNYFAKNPSQGYCLAVAAPKVAKFRKTFARLAKP